MSSPAIRKCNLDDVPLLVLLAGAFHNNSIWAGTPFDVAQVENMAKALIPMGGVFTNGTGFIAGMLTPLHFSPSVFVATELAWWAPGGGGSDLRDAFEAWAMDQGATLVQFSALADDNFEAVNRNFIKNGYKLTELSYVKRVN